MASLPADNATKRQRGRPFPKGVSGNPKGCATGSRHKATLLLEKLMSDDAEEVVQSVISAAKGGDMTAARLVLERIVPVRKGRPVNVNLPPISSAEDVSGAIGATIEAMAQGDITPDEASVIAGVLEVKRKAIETVELDARLSAVEEELKGR